MKRYLFISLAMLCMAITSVSLTSCGDDEEKKEFTGYSGTAQAYIYDPQHQLSDEHRKFLQQYIDNAGPFVTGYDVNKDRVDAEFQTWFNNLAKNIDKYIDTNPDLKNTDAGIRLVMSGPSGLNETIIPFKDEEKEQK